MTVVCGKSALDPDLLRMVCRGSPHTEVYALPWVNSKEGLDITLVNRRHRPNRLFPCEPNNEPADGEYQEMDSKLDGDAFGRMAHLVAIGQPVLNEVMKTPCESQFYGRVLVRRGASAFLLDCGKVDHYFPSEPLSAKLYAATTAMVRFGNTGTFAGASGCHSEFVDVILASQYLPGSVSFMHFYRLFSGLWFVGIVSLDDFVGKCFPRFRYNRAYRRVYAETVLRDEQRARV